MDLSIFHHGLVGDTSGGGVVALNGRGGMIPAHFDESFSEGYHGLGADEEACEFGFSGGRHDVLDYLGYCEDGSVERGYRGVLGEHDVSAGADARTGDVEIRRVRVS